MENIIVSPILIFGDVYLCKNNIITFKHKYTNYKWVTKSASNDTLNSIRAEAGIVSWDDTEKILLIQDIPNKKQVRDFLIDLSSSCPSRTKLIIWDSNNNIKVDPKEKTIDKTWSDFINKFKAISGSKVINNGNALTEKESTDSIDYVVKCFEKYNKQISNKDAKLLVSIVGYDRGMLLSDIQKLILTCPNPVSSKFILDNAFPTTKEAMLYKINNVLDEGSVENAINLIEKFLISGINSNQIAELMVKKVRWQMIVSHLWYSGLGWESIPNKLMDMGKFPSSIWHNDQMEASIKKRESETLQDPDNMRKYMNFKQGIPLKYLKTHLNIPKKSSKSKAKTALSRKNAEVIPMYFMAQQVVDFIKNRIVKNTKYSIEETKVKLLERATNLYSLMQEKLADIRYGEHPEQKIQEMIVKIMDTNLY